MIPSFRQKSRKGICPVPLHSNKETGQDELGESRENVGDLDGGCPSVGLLAKAAAVGKPGGS